MNESEEMFTEIQDEGMADIGTSVQFNLDGKEGYRGTINSPDASTQMLTGGYQGRSEMVILATRNQFATAPAQRGTVTITSPEVFKASLWDRKQVETYSSSHFAITILKQLPSQ